MLGWGHTHKTTPWETMGHKVANMVHKVTPGNQATQGCKMPTIPVVLG